EAALRQAPMDRHLAALEALDGDAGARLLALVAVAAHLAEARSCAAAAPLAGLRRARIVAKLVESHDASPLPDAPGVRPSRRPRFARGQAARGMLTGGRGRPPVTFSPFPRRSGRGEGSS